MHDACSHNERVKARRRQSRQGVVAETKGWEGADGKTEGQTGGSDVKNDRATIDDEDPQTKREDEEERKTDQTEGGGRRTNEYE
mmetsp:Transcript_17/g.64  ORF Transcript_17/g.64 Transcript_17/m.64 type:complete len:84 (-) Transcript_17:1238-1489(-)